MQCQSCGTTFSSNTKHCPKCGMPVEVVLKQASEMTVKEDNLNKTALENSKQEIGQKNPLTMPYKRFRRAGSTTSAQPVFSRPPDESAEESWRARKIARRTRRFRRWTIPVMLFAIILLLLACAGIGGVTLLVVKNDFLSSAPVKIRSGTPVPAPSLNKIDPVATSIISSLQTAQVINQQNQATKPASVFTTAQTIYATFTVNSHGQDGYIQARWYLNNQVMEEGMIEHHSAKSSGSFSVPYYVSGEGAVELYWCTKARCSDAKLAQVAVFTVQDSSSTMATATASNSKATPTVQPLATPTPPFTRP